MADAGLAGDHVGVVEGMDELHALLGGGRAGEADADVDRLAAADDLAAKARTASTLPIAAACGM